MKHRRSVFFVDQSYFVIVDEAVGDAKGTVNLNYHLCEGTVNVDGKNHILTTAYAVSYTHLDVYKRQTKSGGKDGKATVTFDSYVGFKKIAKKLDVLSTYEFTMLDYERRVYDATTPDDWEKDIKKFTEIYGNYSDLEKNYGNRKGLDWQDETLGRTAITQNYRCLLYTSRCV